MTTPNTTFNPLTDSAMNAATTVAPVEVVAGLYLLPVPLADGDITNVLPAYNIEVVKQLKYFVIENLRSARRFLKRCDRAIDIDSLHMVELNEHTPVEAVAPMLDPLLKDGHAIGVLSEAGCPAVADPGADLVAVAQRHHCRVIPLVGPSSILLSLMASGFNGQSFAFNGYLPVERDRRAQALKRLARLSSEGQTQIFIETPYRNNRLIDEMCQILPESCRLCVAADITGPRQSIITDTIKGWRRRQYDYSKTPTIFLIHNT